MNRPFSMQEACVGCLRRGWRAALFFLLAILLLFVVYGLYGLPWGPACYTALLLCLLAGVLGGLSLRGYCRALQRASLLCAQARAGGCELPAATDPLGREARALAEILLRRCQNAEQAARQSAQEAAEYYTLWSHQIKTPLAAMRLLLDDDAPDRGALRQELFKTEQYVDMALQYQRLGGGTRDLLFAEYEVDKLVRQAVKRVATLFIHKGVAISLQETGLRAVTDEKWLVFVLEQLLTNAVKYTPAGGAVSVYADPAAPAVLVVEDNGIGIRPQDLPRVFEWGYTGANGRAEQRSTGIGLSLCRQALAMLGHSVSLQSQAGRGTRVLLDLSREPLVAE